MPPAVCYETPLTCVCQISKDSERMESLVVAPPDTAAIHLTSFGACRSLGIPLGIPHAMENLNTDNPYSRYPQPRLLPVDFLHFPDKDLDWLLSNMADMPARKGSVEARITSALLTLPYRFFSRPEAIVFIAHHLHKVATLSFEKFFQGLVVNGAQLATKRMAEHRLRQKVHSIRARI
ncbi:hypothetical protein BC826DRAFT_973244 [Russula brevipes]|nr:hypothetical protein BC826DRAFT_973244 [Russula brevipes]